MATYSTTNGDLLDPALASALVAALRGLRFGSIEVVVHDSRVVQLERRERVRLAGPGSAAGNER
ncbi:MAG TPA: YezD family protein [Gemmatimonadales bacterium]|jgi:hypothetical protein|nr:YezD family protein [Gemmatimonadales bacterium]